MHSGLAPSARPGMTSEYVGCNALRLLRPTHLSLTQLRGARLHHQPIMVGADPVMLAASAEREIQRSVMAVGDARGGRRGRVVGGQAWRARSRFHAAYVDGVIAAEE